MSGDVGRHRFVMSRLRSTGILLFDLMPTHPDNQPPPSLSGDITFEINSKGFEIWFSDRIANGHPELVDRCAGWMEDKLGLLNLGQLEHRCLLADGLLTDEVKDGLVAWWAERVEGLELD